MGTVGLNFGSPTSGAGFDVSATVSQIVANLQKVETPWKTQLTALQGQDTVLSNLGTLLSKLSTDVSQLTDFTGVLAQKTGSSSDTNVLQLSSASSSAVAGTHMVSVKSLATTSSGTLTAITNASDKLSGSITIKVGSGTAHTINVGSNNTLAGLAASINSAGIGVTASVLTDSKGSRLSLVSGTSGAGGNLTIGSSIVDTSNANTALSYSEAVHGVDAQLKVDGVDLSSASNTVTNLIPGVTFQLLAPSAQNADGSYQQLQVIIGNDNSGVESAIGQMVADYNSLIAAMKAQEGKDSSGNPEPLFGSPTLGLLQQQLVGSINVQNPSGYLDAVEASANTMFSGSMTIQVGQGTIQTVVIGAAPDPPDANTIYTGNGVNTLQGIADAINRAGIGITAGISTQYGESRLMLSSQITGIPGALTVSSALTVPSDLPLSFTGFPGSADSAAVGKLDAVPAPADILSGSITIQVGDGQVQTVSVDSSHNTLQGLAEAINATDGIGVTASVAVNEDGSAYLSLESQAMGTAGNLTVTSNLLDTTATKTKSIAYTNSSDLSGLASLGITVSSNYDGTLQFDASVLDAALNSDFNSVIGFFQSVSSWGQNFASVLNSAGNTPTKGVIALAQKSNSNMESMLNKQISKQEDQISIQQKSLTAELNTANEIIQGIKQQLDGINILYSAITGYKG
ncbi:flagellar filament capping protein FliD [Occallatibacter riparius]|uniref:Flagellar hook-associated protein 2 n=1 Tax=Occallatibacter riparius TaxID=1002689 RepID=A0A9J7BNA2_9BACT|nr:flagellar filament capping protein FliD [Occallatibacter riparius]UWZ83234.1 flagellar filament capping protein FliD [Occallatibacter riparius]